MTFRNNLLFLSICAINIAFGSDQKRGLFDWRLSTFSRFIKNRKVQEGDKAFVDRRAVAFDAIENDLKPKGIGAWFRSWRSKPLYDLPILEVKEAGIDTEAQVKATEMAKKGGYIEPHKDKPGRSEASHHQESDRFEELERTGGMWRSDAWNKVRREFADRGDIVPDSFVKFDVTEKTLGNLFESQKQQKQTARNLLPLTDESLDYKLGKAKQKEEVELLDKALDSLDKSIDRVDYEERKIDRHLRNAMHAADTCKWDYKEGKISDDSPCKVQERYYMELIGKNRKLDALQRKNLNTKQQLSDKREEIEQARAYNKWWKFWTKQEIGE